MTIPAFTGNPAIAARTTRHLPAQLTAAGITLPDEVTAALVALDALEDRRPVAPSMPDLIDAYASRATDKAIDALAVAHMCRDAKIDAWKRAMALAGKGVTAAVTGNAPAIVDALRELAVPLIDKVTTAAALSSVDVATLIRAGDTEGADLAARIETTAGELANLYRLRDRVTQGATYGQEHRYDCGTWKDPRPLTHHRAGFVVEQTPAATFLAGIKAGGELWFPAPDEAQARARTLLSERKQANEAGQVEAVKAGASTF